MIKVVYQIIKKRLEELTELKEVDWYTRQYDQSGEQAMYVDDACYIEFMPVQWRTYGRNVQQAVLEFDLHFVQDCILEGDQRITDAAMDHLTIVDKIYKKFQNWGQSLSFLPEFASLQGTMEDVTVLNSAVRTTSTYQHDLDNMLVTVQRFQATIIDVTALPVYAETMAMLDLEVTLQCPTIQPDEIEGLKMWFDADDASTVDVEMGKVLRWRDKADNVEAVAPAPVESKPALDVSKIQGKSLIYFFSDRLDHPVIDFASGDWTYFVVINPQFGAQISYFHTADAAQENLFFLAYSVVPSAGFSAARLVPPIELNSSSENPTVYEEFSIRGFQKDKTFKNGVEDTEPGGATINGGGLTTIGTRADFTPFFFKGWIGEIIAYNRELTTDERQNIEGYLAQKWGLTDSLPPGHPFK